MIRGKIIALALSGVMVMCSGMVAFADTSAWDSRIYPQDIINTVWLTPVKFLMDKKIITGSTDGLFHPDDNITRAEFATMMAKATNNVAEIKLLEKQNYFDDLAGSEWAKGYINACAKNGLIKGKSEKKFEPKSNATYSEVITVILRSKGVTDTEVGAAAWPNNYITYVQANQNNMIADRNITDWSAPATRGDVAMILYRSMPKSSS